ncbi:unnamed protein product [Durusdinium trenchii]|uniref:PDZ domain-containing protein n=1 Tax=Durusdinium trenchii TaxID=1381693 RepID=A0ABP0SV67_9DINO
MSTIGCSGFYTGLESQGLRAPDGVPPSVPLGRAGPLQGRSGLRLRAVQAPFCADLRADPPSADVVRMDVRSRGELEGMSEAKLKQLAMDVQSRSRSRGKDLPILPAHRDGLILWILKAQVLSPQVAKPAAGQASELQQELLEKGLHGPSPAASLSGKEKGLLDLGDGRFRVSLDLNASSPQLGIEVDNTDLRGSMILHISEDGLVQRHNELNPQHAISVYDRIVSLNGEATPITELHRLRLSSGQIGQSLVLVLSRPKLLPLSLTKDGSLGLQMKYTVKSAGIIIDAVLPSGLIEEWNASHELSERVMAGDRIIALDGQQMPGRKMVDELKMRMGTPLELTILHYSDIERTS